MAHYGTLNQLQFEKDIDDIRGSRLYGLGDEKLGEIKDVIFDHATGAIRYAVVDTGGWLKTRLFLVPAMRIHSRAQDADDFAVDLTKEQIERFPAYNESLLERQNEFSDYEERYRKQWGSGPVLHRSGSDHIITPEAEELPPATGDMESAQGLDLTPSRIADKFSDPAPNPNKIRLRPSGLAAKAEDERLPGSAAPAEKPIQEAKRADATASRAAKRDTIMGLYDNVPQANTEETIEAQQDRLTNPDDIYTPAAERNSRFVTFEEHLRRNRVAITARCGSCATVRDKDKAA